MPTHVASVAIMMLLLAVFHLWLSISILRTWADMRAISDRFPEGVARYANVIAWVVSGAWVVGGIVWTPLNAWALSRRRRWARASVITYSVVAILSGCCLPFGAYGLYAMLRKDAKKFFSPSDGSVPNE